MKTYHAIVDNWLKCIPRLLQFKSNQNSIHAKFKSELKCNNINQLWLTARKRSCHFFLPHLPTVCVLPYYSDSISRIFSHGDKPVNCDSIFIAPFKELCTHFVRKQSRKVNAHQTQNLGNTLWDNVSISGKCYKTNSQEIWLWSIQSNFFKMWTFPQLPTLMNELVDSPHKPVVLLSFFQNWRFWIGKYFQQNFTENTLSVGFWINTDNIRVNEQHFWMVACFFIAYFIENYYHSLKNLSNFCTRAMVMRLRIQHKYAHTWIAHPSERYF